MYIIDYLIKNLSSLKFIKLNTSQDVKREVKATSFFVKIKTVFTIV